MSLGQIAKELNEESSKISKIVGKLIKSKEIKSIEISNELANKKYGCKRRMRLYYV